MNVVGFNWIASFLGRRRRPQGEWLMVFVAVCATFAGSAWGDEGSLVAIDVPEPSGVAYHAKRDTIVVVSDAGQLVELDRSFKVLQRIRLRGDLEGVSVHPATGSVFIASESAGAIYEYDLEGRRVLRTLLVDFSTHADFSKGVQANKGLEGVAVVPVAGQGFTLFAVVEREPARLIRLVADVSVEATNKAKSFLNQNRFAQPPRTHVSIARSYDLQIPRLSDVVYIPSLDILALVSARPQRITLCDREGRVRGSLPIPGKKPEGLCLLPDGDAIVVHDTGGLWHARGLLASIKSTLKSEP